MATYAKPQQWKKVNICENVRAVWHLNISPHHHAIVLVHYYLVFIFGKPSLFTSNYVCFQYN